MHPLLILNSMIEGKASSTEEIINLLRELSPLDLALCKVLAKDKTRELLDSPEIKPLWVEKFNQLRVHTGSSSDFKDNVIFQFRDPAPQTKANFYCGYVLYLEAKKAKAKGAKDKHDEYLSLAISRFQSFHAQQALFNELILCAQDNGNAETLNDIFAMLGRGTPSVAQQKTPTSLLFANTYFYLASFYLKLKEETASKECYKLCWEYLHIAQLHESNSTKEIYNAYYNKGIAFSNSYGISSIADLKRNCLAFADAALSPGLRSKIETDINNQFKAVCKPSAVETLNINSLSNANSNITSESDVIDNENELRFK